MTDDKITRSIPPSLFIENDVAVLIFNEDEIIKYPYNTSKEDKRRSIVIPVTAFNQWIKDNYEDIVEEKSSESN